MSSGIGAARSTNLYSNLVVGECKEVLPQSVAVFFLPLLREELDDLLSALEEGVAVAPDGVGL